MTRASRSPARRPFHVRPQASLRLTFVLPRGDHGACVIAQYRRRNSAAIDRDWPHQLVLPTYRCMGQSHRTMRFFCEGEPRSLLRRAHSNVAVSRHGAYPRLDTAFTKALPSMAPFVSLRVAGNSALSCSAPISPKGLQATAGSPARDRHVRSFHSFASEIAPTGALRQSGQGTAARPMDGAY